jgi:thiaminase/transcriptional activator TenA
LDFFERLRAAAAPDWSRYVEHPFVLALAAGTLSKAVFQTYLVQDYLFLIQFARANALAIYKGRSLSDMRAAHSTLSAILDVEMGLHIRLSGIYALRPRLRYVGRPS